MGRPPWRGRGWSRPPFQCPSRLTRQAGAFRLTLWEGVTLGRVSRVPSLFVSNSSQAPSWVCAHGPFWLWEPPGQFWPVSFGVSWDRWQFATGDGTPCPS